jgi:hypothetical protein
MMQLIFKGRMSKIDIGIITRFIELELIHQQKEITSITPQFDNKTFGV